MAGKSQDPLEKLATMIDDRIEKAFAGRDQKQKEEKDPWARLEGMVDRAVAKHFQAFGEGLGDGGAAGEDDEEGDRPKLGILGL